MRRQRRLQQDLHEDVDWEIKEFMDLGAHERGTDSDAELFASKDEGEEEEESDDIAIFGDPGADRGGEGKSKRAVK